ncbi:methyltransferase domain-containing protein [Mycena sanguinolenta]|nr:methyltransferase domain-containing protein [Mycena sanguinolenta]
MARLNPLHFLTAFLILAVLYLIGHQKSVSVFDLWSESHSYDDARHPHAPPPPPGLPPPRRPRPRPASQAGSRLNLTLAGNELRYQAAVRERKEHIKKIGGPGVAAFPEPNTAPYVLWDLYGPAFSCPFPVYRVGTMGDGGKWVCGLERATHHRNCVIYSMGVERQSSFEQEVLRQSNDCQVYGFDFSVSEWGPELRADTEVRDRAHFFPYKIGADDDHSANPKQYSLQGIMKELGHDFIDIWKIDIEGSEFPALKAVIESFKGKPLPFGQMQIEIHLHFGPDYIGTVGDFDKWWTMLEDAGLRPFWTELNLLDVNTVRRGPFVGEWSFINIRGKHPLVDDSLPE